MYTPTFEYREKPNNVKSRTDCNTLSILGVFGCCFVIENKLILKINKWNNGKIAILDHIHYAYEIYNKWTTFVRIWFFSSFSSRTHCVNGGFSYDARLIGWWLHRRRNSSLWNTKILIHVFVSVMFIVFNVPFKTFKNSLK